MVKKLVIGNWKLNGNFAANKVLLNALISSADVAEGMCVVCVPYPYLSQAHQLLKNSPVLLGAQNASEFTAGPYTGEVSAVMLAELGCRYVIVGHSERRTLFAENDAQVGRKAAAVIDAGLIPVVCVGETLTERDEGRAVAVIERQLTAVADIIGTGLADVVVAYEPVWAIGSGRSATSQQVAEVHCAIHAWLSRQIELADKVKILYGGSVKPATAAALFSTEHVDGGLIGGASLVPEEFLAICRTAASY